VELVARGRGRVGTCVRTGDASSGARCIAQMMRAGLYRPVHVKTLRSQKLRMLLTHRKLLQSKAIAIENDLRGSASRQGRKS
jgi:transposase